ncbi:uncharacterized protein LOC102563988 [Alligator mississippiensis]|uniref:Histone H2B.3 n=1 Tax=Alligator mississippiensis TaxID=8496 RepID=A0A151LYH9_ALLMI|nr:uncharacterized protein LOC102563988 [Alligator mississippiensis]KYO17317.1 histone H2B.3 [Alligator mississippiensis]
MAAAQRGRKKTQNQRRRKSYGRRHQTKQGKSQHKQRSQTRRKPALKQERSSHGKKSSSKEYDSNKVLKQLKRDNKLLSNKAKGLMISFVNDIYKRVSMEAERLRKQTRRPTIGPTQMQAALWEVMPKKRVRHSAAPVSRRSY